MEVLGLESPVFMGCSVGGLLALDLAHKHADLFRAVISLEGALNIEGRLSDFGELWHPQVNSEYKARLMEGIMAPTSPAPISAPPTSPPLNFVPPPTSPA